MSYARLCVVGAALSILAANFVNAKELDFLQTDPRFTGQEVNPANPTQPNFWFYDQYQPARMAMQTDGFNIVPVTSITLPNLRADSDAFYIPAPTNPNASTYPLTDAEIATIQQYVQGVGSLTGGQTVIFDLSDGVSAAMVDNLLSRLGLTGQMASGTISGATTYPIANQPILSGPVGAVGSFTMTASDYMSSLGNMRSLVNVNGQSVLPYVEKGDLGASYGAYFFILDQNYLPTWTSQSASAQNLWLNLANYATQDQPLHFVAPAILPGPTIPEPKALIGVGCAGFALLMRRQFARG